MGAILCHKETQPTPEFVADDLFKVDLFFVGAPNAGYSQTNTGSGARTLNLLANQDYSFFHAAVKAASRAVLDAMIEQRIDIAVLPRISCGIQADKHMGSINDDFKTIIDELLQEKLGDNSEATRGAYFRRVLIRPSARGCAAAPDVAVIQSSADARSRRPR
jgi:hypothetical protein